MVFTMSIFVFMRQIDWERRTVVRSSSASGGSFFGGTRRQRDGTSFSSQQNSWGVVGKMDVQSY